MDMILSSPARGHVIIHQARASDRNFMRLPWGVSEYAPEGKAAEEVADLWSWCRKQLEVNHGQQTKRRA
jgi:hypothetical protein